MQAVIEMEGFQRLFFYQYSLSDCALVESVMREIGADRPAFRMDKRASRAENYRASDAERDLVPAFEKSAANA